MKVITIHQEGSSPFTFYDDDNRDKIEYSQELSAIMSLGKITLLHTSNSSLIIRPHKITAIQVYDENEIENHLPEDQPETEIEETEEKEQVDDKKEEPVDFLTDM